MDKGNKEGPVHTVGAPSDYGIIEAPSNFLDNVGVVNIASLDLVMLADGVLQRVKPEFETSFGAGMRALKSLFVQMRDTGKFDLPLFIRKVHDIRGEAGTFAYQLVSGTGRMIYEFIPSIDKAGQTEQMAIVAHL